MHGEIIIVLIIQIEQQKKLIAGIPFLALSFFYYNKNSPYKLIPDLTKLVQVPTTFFKKYKSIFYL